MYSIVVWLNEDTLVPTVIGPYESDLAFDDANILRPQCHKVQVCSSTTPDKCQTLTLLSSRK